MCNYDSFNDLDLLVADTTITDHHLHRSATVAQWLALSTAVQVTGPSSGYQGGIARNKVDLCP